MIIPACSGRQRPGLARKFSEKGRSMIEQQAGEGRVIGSPHIHSQGLDAKEWPGTASNHWTVDWTPRLNTGISSTLHAVLRAQFAPQVMGGRDSNIIFGAQMNPVGQQSVGVQRRLGPTPTHASGRGLAGASDRAGCR